MAILIAGAIAQKRVDKRSIDDIWKVCASEDEVKLTELMFILRGIRFKDDVEIDNELFHRQKLMEEAGKVVDNILDIKQKNFEKIASLLISGVKQTNRKFDFSFSKIEFCYSDDKLISN